MKRPLLLVIIWTLCQSTLAQEPQVTMPGSGISLHANAPVPEGFAEKIIEHLLPSTEWKAEGLPFPRGRARAYQVTYSKGGGLITVDRVGVGSCRFSINVGARASARLRHQILVGTDMAQWEIIRRDPPSPDHEPFARTYLLRLPQTGELRGLAFYEGTWVELLCGPLVVVPEAEAGLPRVTWNVARRLREAYEHWIAPIAKALDDGSVPQNRPDLPDADTRPDQPTRKP